MPPSRGPWRPAGDRSAGGYPNRPGPGHGPRRSDRPDESRARSPFAPRPTDRRPPDLRPPDRRPPDRFGSSRGNWPPPDRFEGRPGAQPWSTPRETQPWRTVDPALPPPDLLGSDEELVAGRRPVEEAFAAGRPAIRLLVVPQRRGPLEKLVLHATRLRIPIVELEGGSLTALSGFDGHQGVALVVEPREFASLDDILARAAERDEPPFVLVLDSLEDPQNVGTLLRSAEAAGVHGVIFPVRRQAPLTPAAIKASAGAVEHLLLCPVDDLGGALADLHARGLRIAGSEAEAPLTARQTDLRGPLAIVVGSEGQGFGPTVRRRCDLFMRIPMRGAVGSLNAAVAGSILLFEAVAQRDPEGRRQPAVAVPWPTRARSASGAPDGADSPAEPPLGSDSESEGRPAESTAVVTAARTEAAGTGLAGAVETAEQAGTEAAPIDAAPATDADLLPGGPAPAKRRSKRGAGTTATEASPTASPPEPIGGALEASVPAPSRPRPKRTPRAAKG